MDMLSTAYLFVSLGAIVNFGGFVACFDCVAEDIFL